MAMTVRQATRDDVLFLSTRLREADYKEIEAAGLEPLSALDEALDSPDTTYVAVNEDDQPAIIFGTSPSPLPELGFVWMMATPCIRENWVQILRETGQWVDQLSGSYKVLANAVHEENSIHIRWLKWAGFVLLRNFQHNGHSFYEFARPTRGTI